MYKGKKSRKCKTKIAGNIIIDNELVGEMERIYYMHFLSCSTKYKPTVKRCLSWLPHLGLQHDYPCEKTPLPAPSKRHPSGGSPCVGVVNSGPVPAASPETP